MPGEDDKVSAPTDNDSTQAQLRTLLKDKRQQLLTENPTIVNAIDQLVNALNTYEKEKESENLR